MPATRRPKKRVCVSTIAPKSGPHRSVFAPAFAGLSIKIDLRRVSVEVQSGEHGRPGDDRDGAERHREGGDERAVAAELTGGGERDADRVVGERPEQVLAD